MKLPLVATRLGIVAFKLIVAVIVILSILPLLTGGIGLDMDEGDDRAMTLEDGVIRAQMPITVRNDGYFDINGLTVSFTFKNQDGDVLAVSEGIPMDIPAGEETEADIELALDLYDLDRQVRSDLIFNGTEMLFDAEISAKYTLDMVQLSVRAGSDMEWGPFISDLQVQEWSAQPLEEGDDRFVQVPFTLRAEDAFNGLQAVAVTEYLDGDGYTSNVTQSVQLTQDVYEMAKIPLSQEAYGRLMNGTANATVRTTLYVLDCLTYDEGQLGMGGGGGDPIYNMQLQMGASYLQDMGGAYFVYIPYSFNTYPAYYGQQAQVSISYWDSQGFQGSYWQTVDMQNYYSNEAAIEISQSAYDRVFFNQELVHLEMTIYYQAWSGFIEQNETETWGVGP